MANESLRLIDVTNRDDAMLAAERDELAVRYDDLWIAKTKLEGQLADVRRGALVQARMARDLQAKVQALQQRVQSADAELARLRPEFERWVAFQQSRSYRLMQIYVRSYSVPIAGPVLRQLRRMAGKTWRAVRPRRARDAAQRSS